MGGIGEPVEHFAPGRVVVCAAAVALVDDHQIEEVWRKLSVDLLPFLVAGYRLVQRQIDFVVSLDLAFGDLVHDFAERREVLLYGLIDEDVAVGKE